MASKHPNPNLFNTKGYWKVILIWIIFLTLLLSILFI